MKLILVIAALLVSACAKESAPQASIDYVGTWNGILSYDLAKEYSLSEKWTFSSSSVQIDTFDYVGTPIDSNTYSYRILAPGYLLLDETIEVKLEEISTNCFVLKSMPGRHYVHTTHFLRAK